MIDIVTRIVAAKAKFASEFGVAPAVVRLNRIDADAVRAWVRGQTAGVDVDISILRVAGLHAIRDDGRVDSRVEGTVGVTV